MHVRHRLARFPAVLDRHVEAPVFGRALEQIPREHSLHSLHERKEVGHFIFGEVGHALHFPEGDHEDVAWEDGLDVDESIAQWGLEEDLGVGLAWIRFCRCGEGALGCC